MAFAPEQFLAIGFILLLSSILQGAIGFASGLFGIPLLMLVTGIGLPEAVAISTIASFVQSGTAAWRLRHEIDYRQALRPLLIRLGTMPLGVMALYYVGSAGRDLASQIVGGVLLAIVLMQQVFRVPPRERLHPSWELLAFTAAGFLLGFCGMGGPPMVLWVLAHNWPNRRGRAFLFFQFTAGIIPQSLCLLWLFGWDMLVPMAVGAASTPILLFGTLVGLKVATYLSEEFLRNASTVVLVLIGISSLVMPLIKGLGR